MLTKKELKEMEALLPKSIMLTIFYRNSQFKTLNSTPALHALLGEFKYYKPERGAAIVLLPNKKELAKFWVKLDESKLVQICDVTIIGKDFASLFTTQSGDLNR